MDDTLSLSKLRSVSFHLIFQIRHAVFNKV